MSRKKNKAQNAFQTALAGLPPEQRQIVTWLQNVKFKRKLFGGVDEADVWRKLEELNALYEKALLIQRTGSGNCTPEEEEGAEP